MSKKPLLWEMFITFVIVWILNYVAGIYDLYWGINEFDSLVHFLAGIAVSLFFAWFYFFSGFFAPTKRNLREFILITLFSLIFVAVVWEIYELFLGEAKFGKIEYAYDTSLDFVMDFLGALVGCLYAYIIEINIIENNE